MVRKIAYIALAGIAAAGGVFLGWKVTAAPTAPKAALISSAPVQTAAAPQTPAVSREAPAAQADKPEGRMEPSAGQAAP